MEFQAPKLVGSRVHRVEDRRLLTGRGRYVSDVQVEGTLHVAILRSPFARARIRSISKEAALDIPGVIGVFTAEDLPRHIKPIRADNTSPSFQSAPYPILANGSVHFAGQPVAAVVADSRYAAEDGVEALVIEFEEQQPVLDVESSLSPEAPILHGGWRDNTFFSRTVEVGNIDEAFAAADYIHRDRYTMHRHTGLPLEPRTYMAQPDVTSGGLILWSSTQVPHITRHVIAEVLDFPQNKLRVIAPDVGGGFGIKTHIFPEEALVCALALHYQRPVQWREDYSESLTASAHSREMIFDLEAAVRSDGTLLGLKARILVDAGAFSMYPWTAAADAGMALTVLPGPYKVDHYWAETRSVATNKCPLGAYRGVARPSACYAIERLMDDTAHGIGMDPIEFRLRNVVQPGEFPYENVTGLIFDSGSYRESLEKVAELLDVPNLRREQELKKKKGRYLGLGVACYTEQSAHGGLTYAKRGLPNALGIDAATVTVDSTGKVTVAASIHSHGQGLETSLAQLAADELNVPLQDVTVLYGDTANTPYGVGTFASRSAVLAGGATVLAARKLAEKMKQIAAHLLEVSPADMDIRDGHFVVRGAPTITKSFREVARIAYQRPDLLPDQLQPALVETERYSTIDGRGTFANAVHAAVIEVDRETGRIEILRYIVVEDCGRMINPMIVDGQVHGGVVQGIGGTMFEEIAYEPATGQVLTGTLKDYLLPSIQEAPTIEVHHLETPSPFTVGGFKGTGEGGAIAPYAAISNALTDALREQGIVVRDLPLKPSRVWELMHGKG